MCVSCINTQSHINLQNLVGCCEYTSTFQSQVHFSEAKAHLEPPKKGDSGKCMVDTV